MSMSTLYAAYMIALRERAELSNKHAMLAFAADELKRRGYKTKTVGDCVVSDVGRGPRLAFVSDGSVEQTAALLCAAASVGKKPSVPLRFVFRADSAAESDGAADGVDEAYAIKSDAALDAGMFGCCYGAACMGRTEFVVEFAADGKSGDSAAKAAEYVARTGRKAACGSDVELDIEQAEGGELYVMRYYDTAKSEQVLMEIERAAIKADDTFGTVHDLTAKYACLPVINHALSVDKARCAAGENHAVVRPSRECDGFSAMLGQTRGCLIFAGVGGEAEAAVAELVKKLIDMHNV